MIGEHWNSLSIGAKLAAMMYGWREAPFNRPYLMRMSDAGRSRIEIELHPLGLIDKPKMLSKTYIVWWDRQDGGAFLWNSIPELNKIETVTEPFSLFIDQNGKVVSD